jgi:guanosine-3',5'-bis(diphosphate) 3'-pyrophosphohydrolase
MTRDDLFVLTRALVFAAQRHREQRRKDAGASPYINHPIGLVDVLVNQGGVTDVEVLAAALLHDTIEDTETTPEELEAAFGPAIRAIVEEVTDDTALPKAERKRLQIQHAPRLSEKAKLVKLADKICNLRDIAEAPPAGWSLERRCAYRDWSKQVIDGLRGVHQPLECLFDEVHAGPLSGIDDPGKP